MRDGAMVVEARGGNVVLDIAATEAAKCRQHMEMILGCFGAIEFDRDFLR